MDMFSKKILIALLMYILRVSKLGYDFLTKKLTLGHLSSLGTPIIKPVL
jgi:hypothetical protein